MIFTRAGQEGYPDLAETPEWNDRENRKNDAIRRLEQFGKAHPQYSTLCAVRVCRLVHMMGQIGGHAHG